MPRAALPSGIEIEYETRGDDAHPPLLLVMGFTAQMVSWPQGFVDQLVDRGLYVIRFDNRDCGLSTHLDGVGVDTAAVLSAAVQQAPIPDVPYRLSDMAADAVGLLDHLGIARAHVVGASMGGMIVQTMAIEHPDRVASLVSVMSTPGDPSVGQATPEARDALLAPPPPDRDAFIDASVRAQVWSSRRYFDPVASRERAAREYDRAFYPEGAARQLAAIYASGDRSAALRELDVPTLVVHGRDDTLITPSGGERTAELIPGARLLLVSDMGHDIPEPLWGVIAESIAGHVRTSVEV
jgi:pimeloyl-ACP methyl ester carboxylesterase